MGLIHKMSLMGEQHMNTNISDSSIRKVVLFVGLAYQGKDTYCV
jgi:hypothetical protein